MRRARARWQAAPVVQELLEGHALEVLHAHEGDAVGLAEVVGAQDVAVRDAAGQLDLALELVEEGRIHAPLGAEDLEGHLLVQLLVPGLEHEAHAAPAQHRFDAVAARQEVPLLQDQPPPRFPGARRGRGHGHGGVQVHQGRARRARGAGRGTARPQGGQGGQEVVLGLQLPQEGPEGGGEGPHLAAGPARGQLGAAAPGQLRRGFREAGQGGRDSAGGLQGHGQGHQESRGPRAQDGPLEAPEGRQEGIQGQEQGRGHLVLQAVRAAQGRYSAQVVRPVDPEGEQAGGLTLAEGGLDGGVAGAVQGLGQARPGGGLEGAAHDAAPAQESHLGRGLGPAHGRVPQLGGGPVVQAQAHQQGGHQGPVRQAEGAGHRQVEAAVGPSGNLQEAGVRGTGKARGPRTVRIEGHLGDGHVPVVPPGPVRGAGQAPAVGPDQGGEVRLEGGQALEQVVPQAGLVPAPRGDVDVGAVGALGHEDLEPGIQHPGLLGHVAVQHPACRAQAPLCGTAGAPLGLVVGHAQHRPRQQHHQEGGAQEELPGEGLLPAHRGHGRSLG
jgi:hypothetical protein